MKRVTGRLAASLGQLFFVLGWLCSLVLLPVSRTLNWGMGASIGLAGGVGLLFGLSVLLKNQGKRLLAIDVDTLRAQDPRPPVVYLRQFIADAQTNAGEMALGIDSSLEQSLVLAVADVGPVIALNRPGEKLPPPGAARRSASNEEWQQIIEGWLKEAKLVLLVAASSDNVSWEIGRCVQLLRPEQLVVAVPYTIDWATFRSVAARHFGHPMPEEKPASGLIAFKQGFVPYALPDTTSAWQRGNRYGTEHLLYQHNLQPAFAALGISSKARASFSVAKVFAVVFVVLALAVLAFSFLTLRAPTLPF